MYIKLKIKIPDSTRLSILDSGVVREIRRTPNKYKGNTTNSGSNRTVWPAPSEMGLMDELNPGFNSSIHHLLFGKDTTLPIGTSAVFYSYGEPDTDIPIHIDRARKCAINFGIFGCATLPIEFYSCGSMGPYKTFDRGSSNCISTVTMGYADIVLIDTSTPHSVSKKYLENNDIMLISYGWDTMADMTFDVVKMHLERAGSL